MTHIQMPEEQWSETEKWVWQEINAGRIADFNAREGRQGAPVKPTTSQDWGEERKLRSDFLKQILLRQPYSSEIPAEGVRIIGAWFAEAVDLGHGRLARQLWLENCRFDGPAKLGGLQIDGWFSLEGSTFAEQGAGATSVDLNGAKITGFVSLKGATFKDVALTGAEVGGHLSLDGATFDGKLNMNGLDVAQSLFMRNGVTFKDVDLTSARVGGQLSLKGATFKGVKLTGARVGGQLILDGATFDGKLDMNALDLAQSLFTREGATFKDVDLTGAKIGVRFESDGATFGGKLNMNGLDVAQHLLMGKGATFKDVDLTGARVGGQLSFDGATLDGKLYMNGLYVAQHTFMGKGATFKDVELTGARVIGQLILDGATFGGKLNMNGLDVAQYLLMGKGATFKDVDLTGARVGGQLSFDGATLDGKLNMNGLDVAQSLFMRAGATFKDVALINAKVGGQLNLDGATFGGKLNMNGLDVAQHLLMGKGATFKDVDLTGARVGGQLSFDGATLDGKLNMNGLDVTQSLFMRAHATFKDVELINAKVGGQLCLNDATLDGRLDIESLVVEGEAFMSGSTFNKTVSLLFSRFRRNLDLSNSEFTGLDLSGTRIEGELRLGSDLHDMTRWRKGAALGLNLRNVHVGALQDRRDRVEEKRPWWRRIFGDRERWEDAWPAELQLEGFTYDRLGGFGGTPERVEDLQGKRDVDMQARDVRWYIDWLARDHSYSPQPYEQLARAFRAAGDPTKANRILYKSRRRARIEARRRGEFFRWLGSCFLDWTIGYGLGGRYFHTLWWVMALTAMGVGVLYFSGQPSEGLAAGLPARFVYSLDQLLPIVEFEKYDKVVLTGGVAYYFYLQKLFGWALGSFLVAGLAGLTQKQ